ncbi:MAG TPA: stage III sporulation protein AF [Clostridiales bacterium]|nr:stage III sporulation protein AF [Clostridiales bacterium]
MIEFLKEWVLSVTVVSILLILVEILLPSGKTKKFVNLVSGFILILTIVQPFFSKVFSNIDLDELFNRNNSYISAIAQVSADKDSKKLKEKQSAQILSIYMQRVNERIVELAEEIDGVKEAASEVIVNEDYNSQYYGEIKKIYVYVYLKLKNKDKPQNRIAPDVNIEKIRDIKIREGDETVIEDEKSVINDLNVELVKKLQGKIAGEFSIDIENIIISVQ